MPGLGVFGDRAQAFDVLRLRRRNRATRGKRGTTWNITERYVRQGCLSHRCKRKAWNVGAIELNLFQEVPVDDLALVDFAVSPVPDGPSHSSQNGQCETIWTNMDRTLERPFELKVMAPLQNTRADPSAQILIDGVSTRADGKGKALLPTIDRRSLINSGLRRNEQSSQQKEHTG